MPVPFMSFPVQGMDFVWLIVLYKNNQTYEPKFSDHVYAEHRYQQLCSIHSCHSKISAWIIYRLN